MSCDIIAKPNFSATFWPWHFFGDNFNDYQSDLSIANFVSFIVVAYLVFTVDNFLTLLWWRLLVFWSSSGDGFWSFDAPLVTSSGFSIFLWWRLLVFRCSFGDVFWFLDIPLVTSSGFSMLFWTHLLFIRCSTCDVFWLFRCSSGDVFWLFKAPLVPLSSFRCSSGDVFWFF